jgi:hypothetical protein
MMRRTLSTGTVAAMLAAPATAFAQAAVAEPPAAIHIVPATPSAAYCEHYDGPPPSRRVIRCYRHYIRPGEEAVVVRPPPLPRLRGPST